MNRFFGILSLLGLTIAGAVHVASLAGVDVFERVPLVWLLHFGMFAVFVPFTLSAHKALGPQLKLLGLRAVMPHWLVFLGIAVFAYAMLNLALFFASAPGGSASVENGRYVLQDHGTVVREISQTEYTSLRARELRMFSGHWLLFYYWPFAYFMFARVPSVFSRERAVPPPLPGPPNPA